MFTIINIETSVRNISKTKHTSFVYFAYRIRCTSEFLFKLKSHDDDKCNFCKCHTATMLHLLVQCENVKRFWSELKNPHSTRVWM